MLHNLIQDGIRIVMNCPVKAILHRERLHTYIILKASNKCVWNSFIDLRSYTLPEGGNHFISYFTVKTNVYQNSIKLVFSLI